MKKLLFTILVLGFSQTIFAQKTVEMSLRYGSKNPEMNALLRFEDIGSEQVNFKGSELIGKYYQLNIKEFKRGFAVKTESLFDGSQAEMFRLDSDSLKFVIMSKMGEQLKLQLQTNRFSSKKLSYLLTQGYGDYALKDFTGGSDITKVSIDKPFYLMAIITATPRKDGSTSYCEVAQSGIDPEKLDQKFNIPHYFLIEIIFRN